MKRAYKTGKVLLKAAMMSDTAYGLQEKNDSNIGELSFLGGSVANFAPGKGSTTEMQFKCQ